MKRECQGRGECAWLTHEEGISQLKCDLNSQVDWLAGPSLPPYHFIVSLIQDYSTLYGDFNYHI